MKKIILALGLVFSISATAADSSSGTAAEPPAKEASGEVKKPIDPAKREELKKDKEAINNACAKDAEISGCTGKKFGGGLMKCLHAYKKEHKKEFHISDGCKDALSKFREDRKSK